MIMPFPLRDLGEWNLQYLLPTVKNSPISYFIFIWGVRIPAFFKFAPLAENVLFRQQK